MARASCVVSRASLRVVLLPDGCIMACSRAAIQKRESFPFVYNIMDRITKSSNHDSKSPAAGLDQKNEKERGTFESISFTELDAEWSAKARDAKCALCPTNRKSDATVFCVTCTWLGSKSDFSPLCKRCFTTSHAARIFSKHVMVCTGTSLCHGVNKTVGMNRSRVRHH